MVIELESTVRRRTARHGLVYYFPEPPEGVNTPEEFRRTVVKINGKQWYVAGVVCEWQMKEGVRYTGPFGLAVVPPEQEELRKKPKGQNPQGT